jgi:RND family efflux transporter MFP subunit
MPPNNQADVLHYAPPRQLKLAGLIALLVAAVVVVFGLVSRARSTHEVKQWTTQQLVPSVQLVSAKADTAAQTLTLPATLAAFENAGIHSRVSGYLKAWDVDIGAQVRQGQLLAEIDTPDLDQQLAGARADLATAQANQALAVSTAARWKNLLAKDAVSQQEYDEKAGDLAAKTSVVNASRANVARLMATAAYKRIVAPFDGVVTSRSTDIGALIAAGTPNDQPLFTVSQIDKLRVYVRVPQSYVGQIHNGMSVDLTAPEHPGEHFTATVIADAQAITAQSGTLLVQMLIDNRKHELKSGGYVQASVKLSANAGLTRIPASALITDETGVHVATVGPGNRVVMKPVTVASDLGQTIQISAGLQPNERIIDSPPDDLAPGDPVQIAAKTAPAHG